MALGKATRVRSAEPVVAAGGAAAANEKLPVFAATGAGLLTGFVGVVAGRIFVGMLTGVLTGVLAGGRQHSRCCSLAFFEPGGWARVLALSMLSRKMEVEMEKRILVLDRTDLFQFVFAGKMSKCKCGLMMCEILVDLSIFIGAQTFVFVGKS